MAVIKEELLKSAKLTGIWEGKLRKIESGEYSPEEFIDEIKGMVKEITISVMSDSSDRRIVTEQNKPEPPKKKTGRKKT